MKIIHHRRHKPSPCGIFRGTESKFWYHYSFLIMCNGFIIPMSPYNIIKTLVRNENNT